MKNKVIIIILLLAIFQGCQTPAKLVQQGQYEAAIAKLVVKVNKAKPKAKDVELLKQTYHAANQRDHDAIQLLKSGGEPDAWPKIFYAYQNMVNRQQLVKALPERQKSAIHFVSIDLSTDYVNAKAKAQEYLYAKAHQLVESQRKDDAREAIDVLDELRMIAPNYPNSNELQRQALLQATNRVLLVFVNNTNINLPPAFEKELMQFSVNRLDEKFIQYDLEKQRSVAYDYVIEVAIDQINVSPERIDRRLFTEQKKVQDGMQPMRDKEGNILLDSTGKVREEPRFRNLEATIQETLLEKQVSLSGSVDFYDDQNSKLLHRSPIKANTAFAYMFAMLMNGDLKAASQKTLDLIKNGPAPFPTDEIMVMDAAKQMNRDIATIIKRERKIVEKTP